MFDNNKWDDLLSKLIRLPTKYGAHQINTKATNQLNLVKIEGNVVRVTTKHSNFNKYEEVPRWMFEKVYNVLEQKRVLSQHQIVSNETSGGLAVKRSAFVIAALTLLPEVQYDRSNNSIKFK